MSEKQTIAKPLTQVGPVVSPYGEDMSKPRQEGGRPAVNQAQVNSADGQIYKAYLEKIATAQVEGKTSIIDQLSYEEINDFGSLQNKFSR